MRYFSLFSGIGGFELGIKQAYVESTNRTKNRKGKGDPQADDAKGQRLESSKGKATKAQRRWNGELPDWKHDQGAPHCVGYSEIDKYATAIYQKHFPKHKNYGDIKTINEKELPDFDLIVGGFPCQSFSIAGQRRGFDDTRGTLFFDIARILREKQPRLFLLENVKGLLSHDSGITFKVIIATITDLGYDCQWQMLNSKDFGVPQNRERVFIVGHLRGTPRPEVFPFTESYKNDINQLNQPTHSNDRVYGTEGIAPTLNTMQGGRRQPKIAPTIRANHHNTADVHFIRETQDGFHHFRNDVKKSSIQGTHVTYPTGKIHALGTTHIPMTNQGMKIRRLTPMECERLQGFPDGWTEGVSDTQRYKCLGNAVTVNVIYAIAKKMVL